LLSQAATFYDTGNTCNAGTSGPASTDNLGDGCPSVQAAISPSGRIAFDNADNFYEVESTNGLVRRFTFNTQFPSTNIAAVSTQQLAFQALSQITLTGESFSLSGRGDK